MKNMAILILLSLIVLVFISCDLFSPEEPDKAFPQIKGVKNHSDYSYLGVGSQSKTSKSVAGEQYVIGLKNGILESIKFVDASGSTIAEDLTVQEYCVLGNYMFLKFCCDGVKENKSYCIYLPTGELFETDCITISSSIPNDMRSVSNNAIFDTVGGIRKIYYENGKLIIQQLATYDISGFTYFFVDKYGNVFSSDWSKGHLLTKNGKLKNLPSTMNYRKGMNGIVYYNDNGEKGYFDEDGNQVKIEDGFFPSFITDDLSSSNARFYEIFDYCEDNSHYYCSFEKGGFNCFRGNLFRITFNEDSYEEENLINLENTIFPNHNLNDCIVRGYALLGKYLYVLSSVKLFRIEMTTGLITDVDTDYFEYKTLDLVSDNVFRISAIDENSNKVTFTINTDGEKKVIDNSSIELSSIHLYPCNN